MPLCCWRGTPVVAAGEPASTACVPMERPPESLPVSGTAVQARQGEEGPAEPVDDEGAAMWKAHLWIASLGLDKIFSSIVCGNIEDQAEAVRAIGQGSKEDLLTLLNEGKLVEKCAEVLHSAAQNLASAGAQAEVADRDATAAELTAKFVSEGANVLSYGDVEKFFGGLEGFVGTPSPNVLTAMRHEHCDKADSDVFIYTSNYGIRTTSRIEWYFVVDPEGGLEQLKLEAWPTEDLAHSDLKRKALPLSHFERALQDANQKLMAIKRPQLIREELVGARMYTGPIFQKYNGVLRGKDSPVDFLRERFESECRGNWYTTTLHVINSCVVKLSSLTRAVKVYRGSSGLALPPNFVTPDEFDVMGGVEQGFLSTSKDAAMARHYASTSGKLGLLFEIRQGMVSRGAEIGEFSQYPHEKEILFAPLTGLEVESSRVEGSLIIMQMRPNVNFGALTIEQVISRRKKLLLGMHDSMAIELSSSAALATSADVHEGREVVLQLLRAALAQGPFAHQPEEYNDDAVFARAVAAALQIKRDLAADVWAADGSLRPGSHLPLFYALSAAGPDATARTATATTATATATATATSTTATATATTATTAAAAAMTTEEETAAARSSSVVILSSMLSRVPLLTSLSDVQADAVAELGGAIRAQHARRAHAENASEESEALALWLRIESALVLPVAAPPSPDADDARLPMSRNELCAAVRTGLRCGVPADQLAPAVERLWALTNDAISAASSADELEKILKQSVEAGLGSRLEEGFCKLARAFVAEGRGIPILANLPLGSALPRMLDEFKTHKKLRKLILKSCSLTVADADALAEFIRHAPSTMYEAYLNGNGGLGGGAALVFVAIADNYAATLPLSAVSMPECGITDQAAATLEQLMQNRQIELVELNLRGNPISDEMKERLRRANSDGCVQSLQI